MLNWFVVNEQPNIVKENAVASVYDSDQAPDQTPSISTTPETLDIQTPEHSPVTLDMEIINIMPRELINEICEFDKEDLEVVESYRYYFYDLLDEIRDFDKNELKHVPMKDPSTFLTKLQYTLEVIVVNDRVKQSGIDTGYSYTDDEYKNAYKKLLEIEFRNKFRVTINLSIGLFILSSLGLLCDNTPSFLSGVYFANMLMYGSLLFRRI
jgi:hypothetical protein